MIEWFRYVRHTDRLAYEAQGWVFAADLGPTHGIWSCLMRWPFAGDPPSLSPQAREAT